jgi:hypothetical protein
MHMLPVREARLRPEFIRLYPDLAPGVWVPANTLSEYVLERGLYQRRLGSPSHARPLNQDHFEFRGGSVRGDEQWTGPSEGIGAGHSEQDRRKTY